MKKPTQFLFTAFTAITLTAFAACSSSSSGTSTDTGTDTGSDTGGATASISTIDDLPAATDPVSASDAATLSRYAIGIGAGTAQEDFGDANAYLACDAINQSRGAFQVAAEGDKTLCIVQNVMGESSTFATDNPDIDIYDGEYHAFDVAAGDQSGIDHVKFKVTRDTNDQITAFEFFACNGGNQTSYIQESIVDSAFTMNIKLVGNETGDGSVDVDATVTGTLNDSGAFVDSKGIDVSYVNDFGEGTGNFSNKVMTLTNDQLSIVGYNRNFGSSDTSEAINMAFEFSSGDSNNIEDWTIGSGAGLYSSDDVNGGSPIVQGWGTSGEVDAESGFVTGVQDSTLDTVPSETPTIAFEGAEIYDCSDTSEATIAPDETELANLMDSCSRFQVTQDHIDCQGITNENSIIE